MNEKIFNDELFDQLIESLKDDSGNFILKNVIYDFFDDKKEDDLANCLDWVCKNQKRPYVSTVKGIRYVWFNNGTINNDLRYTDNMSNLPEEIYKHLENYSEEVANHRYFDTYKSAEVELYRAWVKAVKSGWCPV